jgi:hypothetical protein
MVVRQSAVALLLPLRKTLDEKRAGFPNCLFFANDFRQASTPPPTLMLLSIGLPVRIVYATI